MKRAIIDFTEGQLRALTLLARQQHVSRAYLVRKAVEHLLKTTPVVGDVAFGLLKGEHQLDSLAYQAKLRSEWSE
ncbi:MAG: hypothetical protein A3J38_06310 [Gammaproteobacteria bacterium RIFCSPHIGHO2_12_FULL_45_9]|nr:MAG: hypothetical protein A3J38_06310 [Gammaproteobacteria bacterium RIFCSPHIGHO2_12_FULL_45_9]